MINPGVCDAAVGAAGEGRVALYLHVESGGTTFETLNINSADDGTQLSDVACC